MDKTQSLHTIRYNACQIKIECVASTATLSNYDYLLNLSKRMDAIAHGFGSDFENEPVANLVANSIHKAMVALIPPYGLGDFDWSGEGEDLQHLVLKAYDILRACDEDGMAQGVCDRHNLFTTMCEMQEKLDEEWLEMLAND
jgi:hypothetical protein